MKRKWLLGLLVLTAAAGLTWATPDFSTFPDPIKPGNILISAAGPVAPMLFGFLTSENSGTYPGLLLGGLGRLECALSVPLTLEIEGGYFTGGMADLSPDVNFSFAPVMGGFIWHPNWGIKYLDTYTGFKMGAAFISCNSGRIDSQTNRIVPGSGSENSWGLALGSKIGLRCFLNHMVGVFAEFEGDIVLGKMRQYGFITFIPRPSAGLTIKV